LNEKLGNIVFKERYSKNNHALLKCKTCKCCFSETRGIVFFWTQYFSGKSYKNISCASWKRKHLWSCNSYWTSKDTICKWVEIAVTHSKEVKTLGLLSW